MTTVEDRREHEPNGVQEVSEQAPPSPQAALADAPPPAGHDTAEPVAWTTPEMDAVLWIDGPPIPPYTVPLYTHPPEVVRDGDLIARLQDMETRLLDQAAGNEASEAYYFAEVAHRARAALAQTKDSE